MYLCHVLGFKSPLQELTSSIFCMATCRRPYMAPVNCLMISSTRLVTGGSFWLLSGRSPGMTCTKPLLALPQRVDDGPRLG